MPATTPSAALQEIVEYRGVEGLVAAEVLTDDDTDGYATGDVFAIAGVAEIARTTDSSNEAHYYDNIPAVVVANTSSDTVTISASAIPLDVFGYITGQTYDSALGALIEGPREVRYFAIGYKTKKTNGDEVYVWRYKGTFNIPDQTNTTENESTDANGQEIVYTGISTTHKFTKTGKGSKALVVDVAKDLADVSTFFDEVVTPDDLEAKTAYTLSVSQAANTTVTVKKGNATVANGAAIHAGDVLQISVTGGTITVNGTGFISGDMHVVAGNVAVVSTASA
jgi:phi13 family phage major tail protein